MTTRGNGSGTGKARIDDPRDISDAVADAVAEHEYWLQALHKAIVCDLTPDKSVIRDDAHLICRFGRWLKQHRGADMLDGELFDALEQAHEDIHEAARDIAGKAKAAETVAGDEYDSFVIAMNRFRHLALEVENLHGAPEEKAAMGEDGLTELESRLTMLNELERERDRAVRTDTPLCLMLVRPQELGAVEGDYGRVGVDRAVIGVAARLFAQLRPYDAVYRYGHAEFLVCLPNTATDQARTVARRLVEAMEESPFALSEKVTATLHARFGIAAVDARSAIQETLERAVLAVESIRDDAGAASGGRIAIWPMVSVP